MPICDTNWMSVAINVDPRHQVDERVTINIDPCHQLHERGYQC